MEISIGYLYIKQTSEKPAAARMMNDKYMKIINEVRLGFETAYIDGSVVSNNAYRPQFVSNNHKEGKKVLSSIEDELLSCDQFQISVAFITMSGLTPLLQTLKDLEKKNIKGQILTTNYLNFSGLCQVIVSQYAGL